MSVTTHSDFFAPPATRRRFSERHPQLAPFLVAVAMFIVSGGVALLVTGLPTT